MLEQHFSDLKGTLKKLLDERLMSLLQEVDVIEQESIKPLDECQKLIEHGVSTADDLLREGEAAPGAEPCSAFQWGSVKSLEYSHFYQCVWLILDLSQTSCEELGRCSEELIIIISYRSVFQHFTPIPGCTYFSGQEVPI